MKSGFYALVLADDENVPAFGWDWYYNVSASGGTLYSVLLTVNSWHPTLCNSKRWNNWWQEVVAALGISGKKIVYQKYLKIGLPCDLAVPLLGIYLNKMISTIQRDICTSVFKLERKEKRQEEREGEMMEERRRGRKEKKTCDVNMFLFYAIRCFSSNGINWKSILFALDNAKRRHNWL